MSGSKKAYETESSELETSGLKTETVDVESGIHMDEDETRDENVSSFSAQGIYDEGMEVVSSALGFVKSNWMAILGAGAVIGVGAYIYRNGLPFGLANSKSSGGKKASRGRNSGKNLIAKSSSGRSNTTSARAHH